MARPHLGLAWADDGQSLIELALALPLLLMTVLGVVDAGRAFYYTSALANAAQVGAVSAIAEPSIVLELLVGAGSALIGYVAPAMLLARAVMKRLYTIRRALPAVLDTLALSAGAA